MYRHQARTEARRTAHSARDGVRDVVELEVEEDVGPELVSQGSDDIRAGGREQLAAHFVEPTLRTEGSREPERVVAGPDVERDDRDRASIAHPSPSSEPTTSAIRATPCRSHQRSRP